MMTEDLLYGRKNIMKPPNFRDIDCCISCVYCECIYPYKCFPPEYKCEKYNDIYIGEYTICDDYE